MTHDDPMNGELRALAEAATPGRTWGAKGWQADHSDDGPGATPRWCVGANGVGHYPVAWVYEERDAAYIAALSPERVIGLLDEVERLRGALEQLANYERGCSVSKFDFIAEIDVMRSIARSALSESKIP